VADEVGERMARLETTTADLRDDVRDNRQRIDQVNEKALSAAQWALEKSRLDDRAGGHLARIAALESARTKDREAKDEDARKAAAQRASDKRLIVTLAVSAFVGPLLILLFTVLINLRGLGG